MELITPTQYTFDPVQFNLDMVDHIVSTNVSYLAISVGVILACGILFSILTYFRFFNPLSRKLKEQESELVTLKEEIQEERVTNAKKFAELTLKQNKALDELKTTVNTLGEESITIKEVLKGLEETLNQKIQKAEQLIHSNENKTDIIDAYTQWTEHYLWEAKGIPQNVFRSLVSCFKKSIKKKSINWLAQMTLEEMISVIPETNLDNNDFTVASFNEVIEQAEAASLDDKNSNIKTDTVQKLKEVFNVKYPGILK